MKDAYELGWEARDRLSDSDLNPFKHYTQKGCDWLDGWIDREFELFEESGLTKEQWSRLMSVKLK
jgi:hypothetical protein